MRALDRLLQRWRIGKALPYVEPGDRLLDVGCYDRSLIDRVAGRVRSAVGVDVDVTPEEDGPVRLVRGSFPGATSFAPGSFDCITALAVFEHVEEPEAFAAACADALAPGGRVVLTVPHPAVDRILDALIALRLLDGMSLEEHHGFDPGRTTPIFRGAGLELQEERAFQLGLNRLYVFRKPAAPAPGAATH